MERKSVETVFRILNEAGVHYLVVGGLAVVAHGYVRLTADVDLVLDMETENLERAVSALSALRYRPRAPVPFADFTNPERRREWTRDKGLRVFSLHSPDHPATEIDLFVESPFDFASARARGVQMEIAPGLPATFVGLDDLLAMKREAGRPVDRLDVEQLTRLHPPKDEA